LSRLVSDLVVKFSMLLIFERSDTAEVPTILIPDLAKALCPD